jgi:hypothetical protein
MNKHIEHTNKPGKTTRINRNLYHYNIFPFLKEEDLYKLATFNKFFQLIVTGYKAIWESELKELSVKWKFLLDKIDINRETAYKSNRIYTAISSNEFRRIKRSTIQCISGGVYTEYKKVNNSTIETLIDKDSYCGGKIIHFKYHHDLDMSFKFKNLIKGKYKIIIRHSYDPWNVKYAEIIVTVDVQNNNDDIKEKNLCLSLPSLCDDVIITNEKFCYILDELKTRNNFKNIPKPITNSASRVHLINTYISDLDLSNQDHIENRKVVVRLVSKNKSESFFGWYLDGIILEYIVE